jgi:cytochrome c oxidase assembly protein subunit 15
MSGRALARRLALAATVLVFLVLVASAWLRHSAAGLGCADWPGCYAAIVDTVETPLPGTVLARLVHRFAASGALVLIGLIAFLALRPAGDYPVERKLAWTALAIALALAALGIWTPGARVPAVAIGNLVGGFALFASLAALSARLREQGPGVAGSAIALVALVVVFAHAMLGGMIGAQFAVTACPPALACPSADFSTLTGSGILDPLRPTSIVDGRARAPAGADALIVLHRLASIAVVVLALAAAWTVRADRARAATIVVCALGALAMGVVATLRQPSLVGTVAHNAFAALLVGALAGAAAARQR